MIHRLIACLLFVSICISMPSTAHAIKWKKVEQELLNLNRNPFDPGSGALVVFNDGSLQVFNTGDVWWELTVYKRIKVFNETGREHATVSISYLSNEVKISDIRARVIQRNGQTENMKSNVIVNLPGPSRYRKIKKFTIPGVADGSVIEYQYKLTSENIYFLHPWFFQGYDYTLSSTLTVTVPREFQYKGSFVNLSKQPESSQERWIDGRGTTYSWKVENLPGVVDEPLSRPMRNRRGGMHFSWVSFNSKQGRYSILENWKDVDNIYRGHYQSFMGRRGSIPAVVDSITAGISNPFDQAAQIFDYVQRYVRYDPLSFTGSTGNYSGRILAGKRAETIDMTVLLCTMLDEAGITAYPAMLAPLDGLPFSSSMPSPAQFERLVTFVPVEGGPSLWLDPSFKGTPFGVIPWQNQETKALILDGSGVITTTPKTTHLNQEERQLMLNLESDGSVSAEGSITASGEMAMKYRRRYAFDNEEVQIETFTDLLRRQVSDVTLDRLEYRDQITATSPVKMDFAFHAAEFATSAGDRVLVSPMIFGRIDADVLTSMERTSSVYLGPVENIQDQITIVPAGEYKIEFMPSPVIVRAPFGRFMARYKGTDEGIVYTRQLSVNHSVISARLYQELQKFYSKISEADQQQVVLVRSVSPDPQGSPDRQQEPLIDLDRNDSPPTGGSGQ